MDHREQQFARGSRLAILADNHPRWVAAYLGIIASGCAAVPLDTALHEDQVTKLLKDSGTSAIFCDAKHVPVVRPAATELKLGLVLMDPDRMAAPPRTLAGQLFRQFSKAGPEFQPAPANDDDLASLLYTSGTTADPKGVMLTHANFLGEVEAVFNWVDLGPTDALLGVLPLFHVLAQMANLLLPLVKGSRVVYLETLNTTELLRAFTERNITAFAVGPQFFYLIHERIYQEIGKRGAITQKIFRPHARAEPGAAQSRHQRRARFVSQSSRHPRPQDALSGDRRLALRSGDRPRSTISASTSYKPTA